MAVRWLHRRASLGGALFALGLAFCAPLPAACDPGPVRERVRVEYLFDGDTVRLADDRRVRLVGLDTPEIGRDGDPDEPLARAARRALAAAIGAGGEVGLVPAAESRDHYGRVLAHLVLADGRTAAEVLLRQGLAVALVMPPNLAAASCYAEAERQARERAVGLWRLPDYQPVAAAGLPASTRGYRRVHGRVERIGRSRSAIWLDLDEGFALRIPREYLSYFPEGFPSEWLGRRLTVGGVVYRRNGQLRMTVRHPLSLQ